MKRTRRNRYQVRGRDSLGLTTLEWLLIVAAVAGLAALAVVLVQNVVDETAEDITGGSARATAAKVAAARITSEGRAELPADTADTADADRNSRIAKQTAVSREFQSKCNRLEITYSDAQLKVRWWPVILATSGVRTQTTNGTDKDEASQPTGTITPASGKTNEDTAGDIKAALCEVAEPPS
ncbi:MAG: hypothetical protein OXG52_06335 [bacterium]|nr:hypothetical protein [bacterium]